MFATASLSVGLPALTHACCILSAVTLVVMFLLTFAAFAPTAAAPFLSAFPADAAPFLIASNGPSASITAGDWSHHSIIVLICSEERFLLSSLVDFLLFDATPVTAPCPTAAAVSAIVLIVATSDAASPVSFAICALSSGSSRAFLPALAIASAASLPDCHMSFKFAFCSPTSLAYAYALPMPSSFNGIPSALTPDMALAESSKLFSLSN